MAIVNKRIRISIVAVHAPDGCYPQSARSIQIERPNTVGAEATAVLIVVLVNLKPVPVVAVQTTEPRPKPHESLPVLDNRPHIGVGESVSNRQMVEAKIRKRSRCGSGPFNSTLKRSCVILGNVGSASRFLRKEILFQTADDNARDHQD